ncbi:MAG TPA: hypothetical protein VM537_03335 [Anaerolineae bacterium]|nr:hypothetical protein [Anaerolineae bacterium]
MSDDNELIEALASKMCELDRRPGAWRRCGEQTKDLYRDRAGVAYRFFCIHLGVQRMPSPEEDAS